MKPDHSGESHRRQAQLNHRVPDWLLTVNPTDFQRGRPAKTGFLRKMLKGFAGVAQNEVFSEKFVSQPGYLQMIDPRVKLLTLVFFMIFCAFAKSLFTLVLLAFVALLFAIRSKLSLKDYFKRVWMILPLVVLALSLPAATNLLAPGNAVFTIYRLSELQIAGMRLPESLYFTDTGLLMILKMSLRTGASLSFAYLLVMTTGWSRITKAFSVFRVPVLVITILDMTYRYIFILVKLAGEMMEARFLRTVGRMRNHKNRLFVAHRMSFLFIKAGYLGEELHDAMRARGFTGRPVSLEHYKMQWVDYLWVMNNVMILFILIAGEWLF